MIQKKGAAQVIDLMLQTYGQQAVRLYPPGAALKICSGDCDPGRALDLTLKLRQAETSFLNLSLSFLFFYLRIDEYIEVGSGFGTRNVHSDQTAGVTHLGGGQSNTLFLIHCFGHILGQSSHIVGDFFHRLSLAVQHRMRVRLYVHNHKNNTKVL
jgi:hypothetical protein